jgi:hypothetical protein
MSIDKIIVLPFCVLDLTGLSGSIGSDAGAAGSGAVMEGNSTGETSSDVAAWGKCDQYAGP